MSANADFHPSIRRRRSSRSSPSKRGEEPPLDGRSTYDAQLLDLKSDALGRTDRPCPSPPRSNVAVVGHRGTGKTSLVEALLFQTGKINRLGSVQAGTTVSDSADDEHERQLSISMSLEHTEWQDRKVNLIDVPGDPAFQGELRCAARVVEGALVTVSAVMGVETT